MTAEMHAKGAHHPEVVKLLRGDAKKQKEKEGAKEAQPEESANPASNADRAVLKNIDPQHSQSAPALVISYTMSSNPGEEVRLAIQPEKSPPRVAGGDGACGGDSGEGAMAEGTMKEVG